MTRVSKALGLVALVGLAAGVHGRESRSLGFFLDRVREHNPALIAERARVSAAGHAVEAAGALPDPTIGVELELDDRPGFAKLALGQRIPWPGTLSHERAGARHRHEAARHEYADMENDVLFAVRSEYVRLYSFGERLALLEETLHLLRQAEETALVDYAAGRRSQLSLLKLQVEVARVGDRIERMKTEAARTRDRLGALIDFPADSIGFPSELPVMVVPELQRVIDLAGEQHPLVKAGRESVKAAREAAALKRSLFMPDLAMGAHYRPGGGVSGDGGFGVSAGVGVPLWFGSKRAAVRKAEELVRVEDADLHEQRVNLRTEAVEMYREYEDVLRRIDLLEKGIVPAAHQSLAVAETAYRTSTVSVLDYLDAHRTVLDLRMELISLVERRERLAADIVLCCLGVAP
jgi:outer membrane protein TolC